MVEKKLQFSDLREARAVLGMKDEFLKTMQREFPDCRIAVRGDTAMIVGSEQEVEQVLDVFGALRYLFRENTYLTTQHVRYSAGLIKAGRGEELHSLYEDTVGISARHRLIKPKTLGQKKVRRLYPKEPRYLRYRTCRNGENLPGRGLGGFLLKEP